MSNYKATTPPAVRERRQQVMRLWASHQGWAPGEWPKDRRYDAIQIQHWAELLRLPMDFWVSVVTRVPKGRPFRWLTTPPTLGRVSLLEELSIQYLKDRRQEELRSAAQTSEELGRFDPGAKARVDELVGQLTSKFRAPQMTETRGSLT